MFAFYFLLFIQLAHAHQSSLTPTGNELFWANPSVPITINANTQDMNSSKVNSIIQNSMAQWNQSSSAQVYGAPSSNNKVRFVSNFPYGSAVVGVTEISYKNSGSIDKAVILLNDDYYFQDTPGIYPAGQIYLGDVVTHELGHLFGLSHSEVLNSSMFYSSFTGQDSVSYDDVTGIRQKYDTQYGSIEGYVKGGKSVGVLGAHVQAISTRTGESSGAVTNEEGHFKLGGLDLDDTYYLYVSPIKKADSLPGYFSNIQNNFCPGSYVGSFFSRCGESFDGKPQALKLTYQNPVIDVGTVSINCNLRTNTAYNSIKLKQQNQPLDIFQYDPAVPEKSEQAFVGWFQNPSTTTWSTDLFRVDYDSIPPGPYFLKVSLVAFPLGSQLEFRVSVANATEILIFNENSLKSIPGSGALSPDYEAFLPLQSFGGNNTFEIKVEAKKLGSSHLARTFPDFNFSSSTYLPYLLVTSLWENTSGSLRPVIVPEANLSDNAACLDAPFTYAVKKAIDVDNGVSKGDDQSVSGTSAGCGTIEPPSSGPGSSLPLLALGFLLALLASNVTKSRKNFLS